MRRDQLGHAIRTACGMPTLRHSAAMRLLQSGTDVTVIALWLGHERPSTTAHIYLHADMTVKEGRSPASGRRPQPQAATGRRTPCSPSSTPCFW